LGIPLSDLRATAVARLKDARALYAKKRFEGAIYVCGYAVEMALKVRICKRLKWSEFPNTGKEWESKQVVKTHEFEKLLAFTGLDPTFKQRYSQEWSTLKSWSPELRYNIGGSATQSDAEKMINATATLVKVI
jgi:hypothetical protein